MKVIRHRKLRWTAAFVAVAVTVAACGSDSDSSSDNSSSATVADSGSVAPSGSAATPETGGSSETSGSTDPTEGASGGTLRVAVSNDPSSLDPQMGPSGTDHQILYPMYDTLISFDPATLEPTPGLAKSWEFTDPTTLSLTLNEGVTFHDGTPMDAAAVKASLERFQSLGVHADLGNVTAIEAPSPDTVVLTLAAPDSSLLLVLADRAGMIVAPSATEAGEAFAQAPIGTGPFQFKEYRPGDRVVYEKYDGYWQQDLPKLDGIEMLIIVDRKAAANALVSGQVDFADGLDTADIEQLEGSGDLTVQEDVGMWFDMVYFNLGQEPLKDQRVRQAFNMAINRDELVEGVVDGYGEPAWMPVPKSHWAYDETSADAWPYDPEGAQALLDEAGYSDGVTITIVTGPSAIETRRNEILKAQLDEVGINLEITSLDLNQGVQQYFEAQAYNTAQYAWSGRPDPSQTYSRLFSSESYQNPGKVPIEGLDELLTQATSTDDITERAASFAEANKLITEFAPYAPLYFRQNVTAYNNKVAGYSASLLGKPKVAGLWLSE